MGERYDLTRERLFNQFKKSPDILDLIDVVLEYIEETDGIIEDIALRRFKDTGEGVWLDIVGEIVGMPRPHDEVPDDEIFTYRSVTWPNNPSKGYSSHPPPFTGGKYQSIFGLPTDVLVDDTTYLRYIDAKCLVTYAGPSIPEIWDFIFDLFDVRVQFEEVIGEIVVILPDAPP